MPEIQRRRSRSHTCLSLVGRPPPKTLRQVMVRLHDAVRRASQDPREPVSGILGSPMSKRQATGPARASREMLPRAKPTPRQCACMCSRYHRELSPTSPRRQLTTSNTGRNDDRPHLLFAHSRGSSRSGSSPLASPEPVLSSPTLERASVRSRPPSSPRRRRAWPTANAAPAVSRAPRTQ
ncbi:hypothetical protein DAEQUDRAFT_402946 [Daedalea quercina L-15889]|uniref:Uncharacterized protein n=1 Tax=Daedalea quercina L-15889 TaxID=1314783 RepID=A0A165NRG6_9APHY|nr:hypothetical protein DAEQUDRAFT_402946 [Daedalea quercina L-15889]